MMLAGVRVPVDAFAELADTVRATGADELADRLEGALNDGVALLALTTDERAIILGALEDPPEGLAELRAVLLNGISGGSARGSTEPFIQARRSVLSPHVFTWPPRWPHPSEGV